METPASLEIHPAPHPNLEVHRAGFPLDHPYLEQCWTARARAQLGPAAAGMPWLWRDATPAEIDVAELGAQLGLGHGDSRHSPIGRTVERIVRFRFASWSGPGVLDVFSEAPPLSHRHLDRVPQWCVERHEHLLSAHLEGLGRQAGGATPAVTPFRGGTEADRMSHQLDQLATARMNHADTGLSR